MAQLLMYDTRNIGELELKAGTTMGDGSKSSVTRLTLFIKEVGYLDITRKEAFKLKADLTRLLKVKHNGKNPR